MSDSTQTHSHSHQRLIPLTDVTAMRAAGLPFRTEDQARWWRRRADERGLAAAFVKKGGRVYVDPEKFNELMRTDGADDDIVLLFDAKGGRFVGVDQFEGRPVKISDWIERDDGLWSLRISGRDGCQGGCDSLGKYDPVPATSARGGASQSLPDSHLNGDRAAAPPAKPRTSSRAGRMVARASGASIAEARIVLGAVDFRLGEITLEQLMNVRAVGDAATRIFGAYTDVIPLHRWPGRKVAASEFMTEQQLKRVKANIDASRAEVANTTRRLQDALPRD